jgi:hypothetical protein
MGEGVFEVLVFLGGGASKMGLKKVKVGGRGGEERDEEEEMGKERGRVGIGRRRYEKREEQEG